MEKCKRNTQVYRKQISIVCCFIIISIVCCFVNFMGLIDKDIDIAGLILIGIMNFFSILMIWLLTGEKSERLVLAMGYVARVILLFIDIYGRKYVVLFSSGADSEGFWKNALDRYNGISTYEYTKYPYLIKDYMYLFGKNRLIIQYINILFWLLTIFIVYKIFELLEIRGNIRLLGICCITFMPQYMILTSILMRESMIVFFNTISLYFFIKWYNRQKFKDIMLAEVMILISMILHSGAVGLGMAYGIVYACYDKRQKIRISAKTIFIVGIGIAGILFAYMSPFMKRIFFTYIPKLNSIFSVQNRWFSHGGSDYLKDLPYTENIFVLLLYTITRWIYFYVSPVPWEWRGLGDMIAFCIDAIFFLTVFAIGIFVWIKKKNSRILIGSILLCCLVYGGIFAWGVSNAGTAMRHRNKLISIMTILLCFSMKFFRKGRKYNDNH